MDSKKTPRKPDELAQHDVKARLREKYPQLTVSGDPFFTRFEIIQMSDEEFEYLATAGVKIIVSKRTLNLVNDRCKKLGIMKELGDGVLHVKKRGGTESL